MKKLILKAFDSSRYANAFEAKENFAELRLELEVRDELELVNCRKAFEVAAEHFDDDARCEFSSGPVEGTKQTGKLLTFHIKVFNSQGYADYAEAHNANDTDVKEVEFATQEEFMVYLDAFEAGLKISSKRFYGDENALSYEWAELKLIAVQAEVLEWNRYTVTVLAESKEAAEAYVEQESPISLSHDDVEYGVVGYEGSDVNVRNIKAGE